MSEMEDDLAPRAAALPLPNRVSSAGTGSRREEPSRSPMSGRQTGSEPALQTHIADGRKRDLRNLLLTAADAARSGRRAASRADAFRRRSTIAIRDRLSAFLAEAV